MKIRRIAVFALVGLGIAAIGRPDDIRGQDRILCSVAQASVCEDDGGCKSVAPWSLNIPLFIEVDLKDKVFSTTKASGENRATPIRSAFREDGLLVLQGYEEGRAFSFVISEEDGLSSIAVARDGQTVSAFGACTPQPAAK